MIGVIAIMSEETSNTELKKATLRPLPWPTGGTKISQQQESIRNQFSGRPNYCGCGWGWAVTKC